jgi:hypothetical protein
MGHEPDLDSANALVALAASRGLVGAQLEADPCGGYEVMMKGFIDQAQASEFAAEAFAVGFDAHVEAES